MKQETLDRLITLLVSVIKDFLNVRSVITLGSFWLVYHLIVEAKPVPDFLIAFVNLLQGYWFGQKVARVQNKIEADAKA